MAEPKTVLLTGVTGFIAKRIALDLLRAGYIVRGSLRDRSRVSEVRNAIRPHLTDGSVLDRLGFIELDLTRDAGWNEAMRGVDAVVHTASPFPASPPKRPDDIIRPATEGTLRALEAAQAAGVRRVVLTSSMVAMMDHAMPQGHTLTEADWAEPNHPHATAYERSKTLAERAAWEFAEAHPDLRLTTINPGLVLGQPMDDHYGTSLSVVERIFGGKDPAVPDVGFPVVDLRDVSRMHVAALGKPGTEGRRYVAAAGWVMMPEMARWIAEAYPERKVRTRIAPRWLLTFLSFFDRTIGEIRPNLGRKLSLSNDRARADMKIRFTQPRDSVLTSAAYLAKRGR